MTVTINGTGTIAGLSTGGLPDGSVDEDSLATGAVTSGKLGSAAVTSGKIASGAVTPTPKTVQTHVIVTSTQSLTGGAKTNITNLNATITPTAGTKILVTVRVAGEGSHASHNETSFGIHRDTTVIGNPDAASGRRVAMCMISINSHPDSSSTPDMANYSYLDSPSTGSAITYHAYIHVGSSQTWYNNRTVADSDSEPFERITSSITLQEVIAP